MATNIAEFISILRRIRDEIYPDITATYDDAVLLKQAIDAGQLNLDQDLAAFAIQYQNFIIVSGQAAVNANNALASSTAAGLSASSATTSANNASASASIAVSKSNEIKAISAQANTLIAGESASASYNPSDGKLTFGIPAGAKGDKGDNFVVNAVGLTTDRALYDGQNTGFSFLDISLSLIYFKLSSTSGNWSTGSPFGKGEKGDIGVNGVGITSVSFVSTTHASGNAGQSGGNDTYRITLSNSNTYDIILHNGIDTNLSNTIALENGTASAGTSTSASRSDHVHPSQTSITGNAGTATKLQNTITIGGVQFTGESSINLPGVNATGNKDTSGNAATATRLQTGRTIGGVNFDGTQNINLPGVNATGNQNTTGASGSCTGSAQNLTTPASGYKHVGVWGVDSINATGAILVNSAFRADRAYAANYADSAGTANSATSITYGAAAYGAAQLPVGEIGTYAFLYFIGSLDPSNNVAGSSLFYADTDSHVATSPTGTWKCMGRISSNGSTVFLRIA